MRTVHEWATQTVVHQLYQTDVNVEHVIRGNSALMRCTVPSFVADYASVDAWLIDSHLVTHNSNELGIDATAYHSRKSHSINSHSFIHNPYFPLSRHLTSRVGPLRAQN